VTVFFNFVGSGLLDPPFHSKKFGDWFLQPPLLLNKNFGSINSASGVLTFIYHLDLNFPSIHIPMQALVGKKLTNLYVLKVF